MGFPYVELRNMCLYFINNCIPTIELPAAAVAAAVAAAAAAVPPPPYFIHHITIIKNTLVLSVINIQGSASHN